MGLDFDVLQGDILTGYLHSWNWAHGENLWHKVDLTATLGLSNLPENYLVHWVAQVKPSADESNVKLLSLIQKLHGLHTSWDLGAVNKFNITGVIFDGVYFESMIGPHYEMITFEVERDCLNL